MSAMAFGKCPGRQCPRVFFSIHRRWKGVYLHFTHGTLRLFRAGGRWQSDYRENISQYNQRYR